MGVEMLLALILRDVLLAIVRHRAHDTVLALAEVEAEVLDVRRQVAKRLRRSCSGVWSSTAAYC